MNTRNCVLLGLVMLVAVSGWSAESIPYQTEFEASEGFVAGNSLNGVDGWIVEGEADAKITDTVAQNGSQSVMLEANSQIDKALTATTEQKVIWMEGYFRGAGTTADADFPGEPEASAIVFFSATKGIQCLNGDGSGSGSWVDSGISIDDTQWYKISIRQDYTSHIWRCYVNETAAPDQDLGFRNNIDTLKGFKNFADTVSYLDTFRVIPATKGDANGDQMVDAADVVTLVNDINGAAMGLIEKDNADVDNDGKVDQADLTALIDKILDKS